MIKHIVILVETFCFALSLPSCSTGIEGTKTIKYSKSERKEIEGSPEDKLVEDIQPVVLGNWEKGRRFLISDNRTSLVFEITPKPPLTPSLSGTELEYAGLSFRPTPSGNRQTIILFNDKSGRQFIYQTGKTEENAVGSINSLDIPMLIDLSTVERFKARLKGKQFWTRTPLWYDRNGEKIKGRKFIPVNVTDVSPGNNNFLLKLDIIDDRGKEAVLYMNASNRGMESRVFHDLFLTSDPKLRYQFISSEVWDLICNGEVRTGMTKEECKLSLGNPDDVRSGHDWNQTIDIWNYNNGAFLEFLDGILTKYRI